MGYVKVGPFTDYSGSPGLSAAWANGVENALAGDRSATISLPTGYAYDFGSNAIERFGSIRIVHFSLYVSAGITVGTKLAVVPAGDRPGNVIVCTGGAYTGAAFIPAMFKLESDGGLTYLASGVSGTVTGIHGTLTYAQVN